MLGKNERKWIDIDLIMDSTLEWIWGEVENASCVVYISDYRCREIRDEQCSFIYDNFDLKFMFSENEVEAYEARPKNK